MRAASALVPTLAFEMGATISATCCLWQSNISPLKCPRNEKLSDIGRCTWHTSRELYRELLARLPPQPEIAVEARGSYGWLVDDSFQPGLFHFTCSTRKDG